MKIAVAGCTGTVGRHVVRVANERGHEVVGLARSAGVDLVSGAGLGDRLVGVDAVVDVTSVRSQRRAVAEAFFGRVTRVLLDAEVAAGVGHHLVLSIVGIDDVPSGYYRAKLLQEQLVAQGRVPWTVLRATQFHEFADQALEFVHVGPLSFVPRMQSQTVACADVAAALVERCETGPGGRVPDFAGPQVHEMVDLSRRVASARGLRRLVVPVTLPGRAGKGMAGGALLPAQDGPRGAVTFEEWLAGG